MTTARRPFWPAALLLAIGLLLLYARPLASGFLNDDHLFLEQARTQPLLESLTRLDPLGNYVRPVSRQLWFAALGPIHGGDPRVFHAASAAVFGISLALLADLLAAFAPPMGVLAGIAYLALLPPTRVLLTWISCSQDLLALMFALAALACFRRRRDGWAAALFALAVFSKESALPLPVVAMAWARLVERESWRAALRRVTPMLAMIAAWALATVVLRSAAAHLTPTLAFTPVNFAAGCLHALQTLLGLDAPHGWRDPLAHFPRPSLALAAMIAAGLWLAWPARAAATTAAAIAVTPEPPAASVAIPFALTWFAAFAAVTGPVAATWSGYFYTLTAVAGAILVARFARALSAFGWAAAVVLGLWVHVTGTESRAFAVADDPWGWTSHLDAGYFDRAARLTDTLRTQLTRLEPRPRPGTRFYFTTLPSWAGFQMGNGALIRHTYRDTTLRSYFYSQFSESTANGAPVRILYWDGAALGPLYANAKDPWFQVGSDLLLFERPAGAADAFRRGLAAGESRFDLLYWLGWAELMQGRRGTAERAWLEAGMHDDTTAWYAAMQRVRQGLLDTRDTLAARRALVDAIMTGPGQPLPHAVLGSLLLRERPKYGLLELMVATWLRPDDRDSRRLMVIGLTAQQLDTQARAQLARLEKLDPGWRRDPELAAVARTLDERSLARIKVVRY